MRRAYTIIEWVLTVSVLLAVLVMFRGSLTHSVRDKTVAVGDYMLWQGWGTPIDTSNEAWKNDYNFQVKTASRQYQNDRVVHTHDGVDTHFTNSTRVMRSAMFAVTKEQEDLISNNAVNDLNVNLKITKD